MNTEQLLEFLATKGISKTAVARRLIKDGKPIDRNTFQSMRRSTVTKTHEELKRMIVTAFPEYLDQESVYIENEPINPVEDYKSKYEKLLTKKIEDLEREKEELKQQVNALMTEIINIAKK